ncbi:MAG TPA: mechanosensitive ion channel family protein [Thermoplasmata archaeon]|nr:mechanosensitive ion channel family protein [Thermoplasmata archaeon]
MAAAAESRPLHVLFRNLVVVIVLAAVLYTAFTEFNTRLFHGFSTWEVFALEAGAIVLLAYFTARAFTSATDAVLRRQGQMHHGATVRVFLNVLIAIGAIFALAHLAGVSVESIFLGSAFAGIVLGLAAQTVLANVFAGLLLVVASPFRPSDRVTLISSSYGAYPPSYPHEMGYPTYSGTVEDVELLYTVLRLDGGGTAKVPNAVVLAALIVLPSPGVPKMHRVRMTFPLSVDVKTVEAALAEVRAGFPDDAPRAPPRVEVTDISPTTWDGVFLISTRTLDDGLVRDRVMRAVLRQLPAAAHPA